MRSEKLIFIISILISWQAVLPAGEADAYFMQGNQLYQESDYQAAISAYSKILNAGYESWEVYYNLGNAYYKQGNIGRAILNYERAKRLAPKNEDIDHNLEIANLAVVDRIQEIPPFFLFAWISSFAHAFSLSWLGGIVLTLYLCLTVLVILRLFVETARLKRMSFFAITVAGLFLILFSGIFSYRIIENETRTEAVVLADKVDVKSAPDANGTNVFTLHEGVKLEVRDRSLDWVQIRLADGKVGWLRDEVIAKI